MNVTRSSSSSRGLLILVLLVSGSCSSDLQGGAMAQQPVQPTIEVSGTVLSNTEAALTIKAGPDSRELPNRVLTLDIGARTEILNTPPGGDTQKIALRQIAVGDQVSAKAEEFRPYQNELRAVTVFRIGELNDMQSRLGPSLDCSKPRKSSNIEEEARKAAACFLARTFVQCGDDYYRLIQLSQSDLYREYKGFSIVTEPLKLSEADHLNGVEWSGGLLVKYSSTRDRSFDFPTWSAWGKWDNGDRDDITTLKKEKGAWEIGNDGVLTTYHLKSQQGFGSHILGATFPCRDVLNDAQHTSPRP